ncbi:hypothetical protein LIA77_06371 [Sarocladium implicatum]|nr:hypothetical protein LIA77_06371 [Sarocladium implicatum]
MQHIQSDDSEPNVKVIRDYLVNDGVLKHRDTIRLRPSSLLEPSTVLRDRYKGEGYLYMQGVVPRKVVNGIAADPMTAMKTSITHRPRQYIDHGTTDAPSLCSCSKCPDRNVSRTPDRADGSRLLDEVPELKGLVSSLATDDPESRNTSPERPGHPRAWLALTNFHPQGGGPIFLQRGDGDAQLQDARTDRSPDDMTSAQPLQLAKCSGRKWMVTAYDLGDIVLYDADVVCIILKTVEEVLG